MQLITHHNPNVSEALEENIIESTRRLDLNEAKFKIAWSIEGYTDNQIKDDPRYVKYMVRLIGKKDNKGYEKFLTFHKCNDTDWDQFPEPARRMGAKIDRIREDPKRGMYCLDDS